MITEPKVTLLATTATSDMAHELLPPLDDEFEPSDLLAEIAGRACYQSWARPNPKTATTEAYIDHILEVRHYSVLAHASATFYIEGVSRSLTHELVRHRFLAFSQLSQRYVNSAEMDWVCPPLALNDDSVKTVLSGSFHRCVEDYDFIAAELLEKHRNGEFGATELRKRCREAARAVLPNSTETKIVVSGNLRAWRDFLAQRWTTGADLEIQRLAGVLLVELSALAPATFADFSLEGPA